jgi:hypothetical protein
VTGCLENRDGKVVITDQTTNVAMEVRGVGIEKEVGNHVEITGVSDAGSPTVKGASQIVNVGAFRRVGKAGACLGLGKAAGPVAAGGIATAAAVGTSTIAGVSITTVAIVGGVAAAGTAVGLAASGAFAGSTAPKTSR